MTQTGAENVRWNLEDLYSSIERLDDDLRLAEGDASAFREAYRGRMAELDGVGLAEALKQYENLHDRLGRAYTYAYLWWSTDTNQAERGALLQRVREIYSSVSQQVLFLEVEWAKLEDERADAALADPALASYRHYLELQRVRKQYVLSEPEERILAEKSVTGWSAWNRYFDETLGARRYELDGEQLAQQEILSKLYDSDRDLRRRAALAFTEGLQRDLRSLTYVANTILADKASDDRLRGYPGWLTSRNLDNEIGEEMVEALIGAVTSRYDIVGRFYELKRRLLGYEVMYDYDRYAPIGEADRPYDWDEARQVVLDAYGDFHPRLSEIAGDFFDGAWIDAPVVPGKRGGAFSHGAVPSAHPYILMNFTGKIRDVQTLAHELGHGVHQYLSRKQGVLQSDTPLTTAETASVFGEMLVFQRLLARESGPSVRLSMLVSKIDDSIATVFRQIAMNRYEDRIHSVRRGAGELTPDQFADHWMETQASMFQGSVQLGDHYRNWWAYIPHFLHTPGYVYAYAFGELLVLALYARYQEEGHPFAEKYLQLLEAGGSDWPHVLVGRLGIHLTDLGFWKEGLRAIEVWIGQAEEIAGILVDPARTL